MSIAITDDHQVLAQTVSDFLKRHDSLGANRALLQSPTEARPAFWGDLSDLGWLGLHISEEYGGSGFSLEELVVVVEEMGGGVAPGPFVPTVLASAIIAAAAPSEVQTRRLPGLVDGSLTGAVPLGGAVEIRDGAASGSVGVVIGGGLADVWLVPVGDDVAIVDCSGPGVQIEVPPNLDPSRRAARITLDGAPVEVLAGARQALVDLARLIFAAEAIGVARQVTESASDYAKVRQQFGRTIATFQAVKHHCANMVVASESAIASVWDASRAASEDEDQFRLAAASAAALALPAYARNAELNIQVHGGIGFTWEHDAHLHLRRALVTAALFGSDAPARDVFERTAAGQG